MLMQKKFYDTGLKSSVFNIRVTPVRRWQIRDDALRVVCDAIGSTIWPTILFMSLTLITILFYKTFTVVIYSLEGLDWHIFIIYIATLKC
jgi:hypothetical protein